MAAVAAFWLVGLGCLIAALAGGGGPVKIGSVQLPGFGARSTRAGAAAVGVLALALGGVLFFKLDAGTGPPASGHPTGSTPVSTGEPGGSTAQDATVLWHDTITLAAGSSVNVGALPIQVTREFVGSSVYVYEGVLNSGSSNGLSQWEGAATPSAAECANSLRTNPVDTLRPRQGLRFCLTGSQGIPRVAYGVITSYDESAGSSKIELTVWNAEL